MSLKFFAWWDCIGNLNIEIICMPNDKSNASLHVLRAYCVSSTILNTYHLVILYVSQQTVGCGYYIF